MSGCEKPIDYTVPTKYSYKILKYKCGNTGIDGLPVLCDECAKGFDSHEFRQQCAENGENVDSDY